MEKQQVKPRGLAPEEGTDDIFKIQFDLEIDKNTRELKGFNIYGLEDNPCSSPELVGFIQYISTTIVLHQTMNNDEPKNKEL
jgi:hypothetical protein